MRPTNQPFLLTQPGTTSIFSPPPSSSHSFLPSTSSDALTLLVVASSSSHRSNGQTFQYSRRPSFIDESLICFPHDPYVLSTNFNTQYIPFLYFHRKNTSPSLDRCRLLLYHHDNINKTHAVIAGSRARDNLTINKYLLAIL